MSKWVAQTNREKKDEDLFVKSLKILINCRSTVRSTSCWWLCTKNGVGVPLLVTHCEKYPQNSPSCFSSRPWLPSQTFHLAGNPKYSTASQAFQTHLATRNDGKKWMGVLYQHLPQECQLNPKGWWIDKSLGTLLEVQILRVLHSHESQPAYFCFEIIPFNRGADVFIVRTGAQDHNSTPKKRGMHKMWGRLLVKPNHVSDFRWDSWTGTCNKWEKFSSFKHVLKEHEKKQMKKIQEKHFEKFWQHG